MGEFAFTFPGGELKTITISATAGNATANKTPGANKRWVLLYARITLVCDATVVDRYINAQLTDGTNILAILMGITTAVTASQTKSVSYQRGIAVGKGDAGTDHAHINMGDVILEGADQFRINITSGVAGDSFSGFLRVLEINL